MKKIWNDPVWSKVIAAIIIGILTIVYAAIQKITKGVSFEETYQLIFEYRVRLVYVIGILLIIYIAKSIFKHFAKKNKAIEEETIPNNPYGEYVEDTFGANNARWTWTYAWDTKRNSWKILNIIPLCPTCKSRTEKDVFLTIGSYANCPKCRLDGYDYHVRVLQLQSDVEQEIIRRVESGEWRQRVKIHY